MYIIIVSECCICKNKNPAKLGIYVALKSQGEKRCEIKGGCQEKVMEIIMKIQENLWVFLVSTRS